jgi:hypothetical protein
MASGARTAGLEWRFVRVSERLALRILKVLEADLGERWWE